MRHFQSAFPFASQPGICIPDLMCNVSPPGTHRAEGISGAPIHNCVHLEEFRVPCNNKFGTFNEEDAGGFCLDFNKWVEPDIPSSVIWNVLTDENASSNIGNLRDNYLRNQICECYWDGEGNAGDWPENIELDAEADLNCQAFRFRLNRSFFGGVPALHAFSFYEIRFTAGFRIYRVRVADSEFATVSVCDKGIKEDGTQDDDTWEIVNPKLLLGGDPSKSQGNSHPGQGQIILDVVWLNDKLTVAFGSQISPYAIPMSALGPDKAPTVVSTTPGSMNGAISVAYSWVDKSGRESELSPPFQMNCINQALTVKIPEGPWAAKTIKVYVASAAAVRSFGYKLKQTTANVHDGFNYVVVEPDRSDPDHLGTSYPIIQSVQLKCHGFTRAIWDVEPLKWKTLGNLLSGPQSLGVVPAGPEDIYYSLYGSTSAVDRSSGAPWNSASADIPLAFPPGASISATTTTEPGVMDINYTLQLRSRVDGAWKGVNYSNFTPIVTRVNTNLVSRFQYCGQEGSPPCTPSRAVVPKEILERIVFQPMAKTIVHTLDYTLDNWHGQWALQSGNVAVKLWLGIKEPAAYPGIARSNGDPEVLGDGTKMWRRFEGFADTFNFEIPSANRSIIKFSCTDRMEQLREPISNPVLMDLWNDYAAMAWLAIKGGFTPEKIAFANLVPVKGGGSLADNPTQPIDPFATVAGDDRPVPFLPAGTGMHSWTPKNRSMLILELMQFVQKPSGNLLYIDQDGNLQYHKFKPLSAGTGVKIFSNNPADWGDGEGLREFWNFNVEKTTRDVKNRVALWGVDPWKEYHNMVGSAREDRASISSPEGSQPMNYVGYPKVFVWSDPRFANGEFATQSAQNILEMLSIPGIEASFETWLQPDLFPMDVVFVTDEKTGIKNFPLMIMSLTNRWSIDGSGVIEPRTSVVAKFLV